MATAKKSAAKKSQARPSTRTGGVKTSVVPESGNPKDTKRPEIDESRHPASGMQELPTAPSGAENSPGASSNAQQGSGIVPSFIDPQPSIGADHGQRDHQDAPVDAKKAKRVTNYAVAASLPVIEKGAKGYSTSPAKQPAAKEGEADAIETFKDENRRTMVVVHGPDGFAACPVDGR